MPKAAPPFLAPAAPPAGPPPSKSAAGSAQQLRWPCSSQAYSGSATGGGDRFENRQDTATRFLGEIWEPKLVATLYASNSELNV